MSTFQSELKIDFGEVGYTHSRHSFKVLLDANGLTELIAHARNAHRVYELMLITRPGDVWNYVWVTPESVSPLLAQRISGKREEWWPASSTEPHPWPEGKIPFFNFDQLFHWSWDDTEPEDEAWLGYRESGPMHTFAQQLLSNVKSAQGSFAWNDPLLRHELEMIQTGTHPYEFLNSGNAIEKGQRNPPNGPCHSDAFYKQLETLLRDTELASVAYRAMGDYKILRCLATEQRRRTKTTGHSPSSSLYISALVNQTISNEAWDSEIFFHSEGIGHGDLFIQGQGIDSNSIKELIEVHHRVHPGRYILSVRDEGEIAGYSKESGDGWWLYKKIEPDMRRRCLEQIYRDRLFSKIKPILAFEGKGGLLFDYENAIIVVGADVPSDVRDAIASVIHEWQVLRGKPLVIVLGDTSSFDAAGCHNVLQPPNTINLEDTDRLSHWLRTVLWEGQRWTDALILLDVPGWVDETLVNGLRNSGSPWNPWVISTPNVKHLSSDLSLEGDVANLIADAHLRAQRMRPSPD